MEGMKTDDLYRDEPIPRARAAKLMPPKYREMRKIAGRCVTREPDAGIFYKQGTFMEDFEDDFDFLGLFLKPIPTYQIMTDEQLRGYFSWRTRLRRGDPGGTWPSFALVYVYELLNGIGTRSPEEGFRALSAFRESYGRIDPQIGRCLAPWLRDYVVYHNLDKSLLGDLPDARSDETAIALLNCRTRPAEDVFAALRALSSYDVGKSRFFKRRADDMMRVTRAVLARLSEDGGEPFFGEWYATAYVPFKTVPFYHRHDGRDFDYEINEAHKYRCRNGQWSRERFFCFKGRLQKAGALLRMIDLLMRRRYDFKPALKEDCPTSPIGPAGLKKDCRNIIEDEIEAMLKERGRDARRAIEIDASRLDGIRKAARKTRDKLIVGDGEAPDAPRASDAEEGGRDGANLSETERSFMMRLLRGEAYDDLLRPRGLMPSVLADAVNEKLFDAFGDTVILCDGDRPALAEDYRDELRGIIGE